MKRMRMVFLAITASFLVTWTSCVKEPDMTLVSKSLYENSAITAIEAGHYWILNVVADSNRSGVEVEYSAYLDEFLDISLDNGLLRLGFKDQPAMSPSTRFKATVYTQYLNRLSLSRRAVANFEGNTLGTTDMVLTLKDNSICKSAHFAGNSCKVHLSGMSELLNYAFEGSICNARLYDRSRIWGNIAANDSLLLTLDHASRFTNSTGTTAYAYLHLDNGSEANILPMPIKTLHVEMNNSAMLAVTVSDIMAGSLQNSSTLYYQGTPQIEITCDSTSKIKPL